MIHVVAIVTAHAGMRNQVLALFRANRSAVLAEAGCIEYGATIDVQNMPPGRDHFGSDTFVVIEKWESAEHLQAHANSAHMAAYAEACKALVAKRAIHVLEAI